VNVDAYSEDERCFASVAMTACLLTSRSKAGSRQPQLTSQSVARKEAPRQTPGVLIDSSFDILMVDCKGACKDTQGPWYRDTKS
jgi:hypothetical protein